MKKSLVVLALVGMVLLVCSTSFAATGYVVTNDDNCIATSNTSSIYTLNTTTGNLALYKTLTTGGLGNCGGFFATVGNGITQNAKCLFVMDGGSNDIAAFTVPALAKVGNYSNAAVVAGYPGGSMAITPNSKSLYATYAGTENIGAWSIGTGCTLTFIAAYQASFGADTYSNLIVDPTGAGLIVSVDSLGALEAFAIQANGSLTDLGSANLNNTACAQNDGCFPAGLDINKKEFLVVGNSTLGASGFTTQLQATSPYFTKVTYVPLPNSAALVNNEVPWMDKAAYTTGTGNVYWGFSGFGAGYPAGVLQSSLAGGVVKPGTATSITSPNGYDGTIQNTGKWMVVSEWFNQLQVFSIGNNGGLTATTQGPVTDANADGALSFFIYPSTR
jgi:hypothetical protein